MCAKEQNGISDIILGTGSGISLRVMFLFMMLLVSVLAAWIVNVKEVTGLSKDVEVLIQDVKELKDEGTVAEEKRDIQIERLRQSIEELSFEMRQDRIERWTKEDDRLFMEKYSEENNLEMVTHK